MRACDYAVYRINYTNRVMHRTQDGMDSNFSHWENDVPHKYLCVAPTQELALAAFQRYHHDEHHKNIVVELVGTLNDMVYLQ